MQTNPDKQLPGNPRPSRLSPFNSTRKKLLSILLALSPAADAVADRVFWCTNDHSYFGNQNDFGDVKSMDTTGGAASVLGPLYELHTWTNDVAVGASGTLFRSVGPTIRTSDKTGGGSAIWHTGGANIGRLAIDGPNNLYWVESPGFWRKSLVTPFPTESFTTTFGEITALAVDSTSGFLYFAAPYPGGGGLGSAIYRTPLGNPEGSPLPVWVGFSDNSIEVFGLSVDPYRGDVYAVALKTNALPGKELLIYRPDPTLGGVLQTPIFRSQTNYFPEGSRPDIAVDGAGGKIYWTSVSASGQARLMRANLDGGTAEVLSETLQVPYYSNGFGGLDLDLTPLAPLSDLPPGMRLWLPFDEVAGSGAATRNLVAAPHGARMQTGAGGTNVAGPQPLNTGFVGRSLNFDGIDDCVDVAHHSRIDIGTEDFSLDAWVKLSGSGVDGQLQFIVDHRTQSGGGYHGFGWFLGGGNTQALQLADGDHVNIPSSSAVPADGQWHFIAVTVERAEFAGAKFYLDGELSDIRTPTAHQGSLQNPAPFRVGAESLSPAGTKFFAGAIDEVELFGRVLSAAEIRTLYAAGTSGKRKSSCSVPLYTSWCPNESNRITGVICNPSGEKITYQYQFGDFGDGLVFTPPGTRLVDVPAGGCVTVEAMVAGVPGGANSPRWQLSAWPSQRPRDLSTSTGTLVGPPYSPLTTGCIRRDVPEAPHEGSLILRRAVQAGEGKGRSGKWGFTQDSPAGTTYLLSVSVRNRNGTYITGDYTLNGSWLGEGHTFTIDASLGQPVLFEFTLETQKVGMLEPADLVFSLNGQPVDSMTILTEDAFPVLAPFEFTRPPNGLMMLTWPTGIVEETSDFVTWVGVPGATSPFTIPMPVSGSDPSRRFFRVRDQNPASP